MTEFRAKGATESTSSSERDFVLDGVHGLICYSLNGHKGINFENHIVFETSDDLLV